MTFFHIKNLAPLVVCLIAFPTVKAQLPANLPQPSPILAAKNANHLAITTKIPAANRLFDEGMLLYYSFADQAAVAKFREATRLDSHCGACYWGEALALSRQGDKASKLALQRAVALSSQASRQEQDLILALQEREHRLAPRNSVSELFACYPTSGNYTGKERQALVAYANRLNTLMLKYPHEDNLKVLYAAALWQSLSGKKVSADNPSVVAINKILDDVLSRKPSNLGANQYVVLNNFLTDNAKALNAIAHIQPYYALSDYNKHLALHQSFATGRVDESYKAVAETDYLRFHQVDLLLRSAIMRGQKSVALSVIQPFIQKDFQHKLAKQTDLQLFQTLPNLVQLRFGEWQSIMASAKPSNRYSFAQGMWFYSQGQAQLHLNQLSLAEANLNKLHSIVHRGATAANLGPSGLAMLRIADETLFASIANSKGNMATTLEHLETAAKIQASLPEAEASSWYLPTQEMLAHAYLAWGDPKNAAALFEHALKQYPHNSWALKGLVDSATALDQTQKAKFFAKQLKTAWKNADVKSPKIYL